MKARNSLIILGIGLATALALALFLAIDRGATGDGQAAHGETTPADRALADRSRPAISHDAAPAGDPSRERQSVGAPAIVDPSTAAVQGGELVEVAILRADTGAPLPGASVWWWPKPPAFDSDDSFEIWLRHSAIEEHAPAAVQLVADASGLVRVPDDERGFVVAAASADLWGYSKFEAERDQQASVALSADRDVRVQVVDTQGAPVVGACVALRQRRLNSIFDHLTALTKAPDGVAVLRHAGRFLGAASGPKPDMLVALPGLLDPPLERPIDPSAAQGEVVKLVLEPSGSCEVVVVDPADEPLFGALDARLSFDEPGAGGAASGPVGFEETIRSRTGEHVVFEHVQLGRALALQVKREGSNAPLELRSPGPVKAGERIELRVRAGQDAAILRGRLVDASRAPAAALAVRARLEVSDGRRSFDGAWSLHTGLDGRFSVETAPMSEVPEGLMLAIYEFSAQGAQVAIARRPLPRELALASYDLGEFVLADSAVLAAGIVVDVNGKPVAGASVTPSIPLTRTEAGEELAVRESWLQPCRSDARGRFEIRGESGSDTLSLDARKQGLIADPVVVRSGELGVRLVLDATGAIEGTVLLDSSLAATMMLVHAERDEPEPAPTASPSGTPSVVDKAGRFVLHGLRAGSYSVHVVYAATGSAVGAVEGVKVRAGEAARDRRLDPLDLRGTCRMIELDVVDSVGVAVRDARAFSRPSGNADARWVFAGREGGKLQFLSTGVPLDIAISATGFLRTELDRVTESQRVTLRTTAKLRLELAPDSRVPDPRLYLGVRLTPLRAGHSSGFTNSGLTYFDASGVLACESEFVGELQVELSLLRRDQSAVPITFLQAATPHVILVADRAGEQVFEIRVDPVELEAAVRALLDG
jgi:hypothetical protein